MKVLPNLLILLALTLSLGLAQNSAKMVDDKQNAMLEKFYETIDLESDITDYVELLNTQFKSSMEEKKEQLGPEVTARLSSLLLSSIDRTEMTKAYKSYFAEHNNPTHLAATMEWLESPVGKKLREMEKVLNTPEGEQALMTYAQSLQTTPPAAERIQLTQEFIESADLLNVATASLKEVLIGSIKSLSGALPKEEAISDEQLVEIENQIMPGLTAQFQQMLPIMTLFVYKDASDEDIKQLIAFSNSEAGKWNINTEVNAQTAMFRSAFSGLYKSIVSEFHK